MHRPLFLLVPLVLLSQKSHAVLRYCVDQEQDIILVCSAELIYHIRAQMEPDFHVWEYHAEEFPSLTV